VVRFDRRPIELSRSGRLHRHRTSESSVIPTDDPSACSLYLPMKFGGEAVRPRDNRSRTVVLIKIDLDLAQAQEMAQIFSRRSAPSADNRGRRGILVSGEVQTDPHSHAQWGRL
jgi:hypothetical protein